MTQKTEVEFVETKETKKKTRAQVLRDKVKIRLAPDGAGVLIQKILEDNDVILEGINWSESIYPYWLLATVDEDVIGCVQVIPAKPFGIIEFLYFDPKAPFKMRAIAAQKLILQAMSNLYQGGVNYSMSFVEQVNGKFYDIIEKYAVKVGEGSIFMKRFK